MFIKLNLRNAYYRIRIKEGYKSKTTFRIRYGLFEYLVMPFGLSNAPATFQAHINNIFADLLDITVIIYLDDILVFSQKSEDHTGYIEEVLYRLIQNNLYAKLSKCEFNKTEIEFLSFIVNNKGIKIEKSRV